MGKDDLTFELKLKTNRTEKSLIGLLSQRGSCDFDNKKMSCRKFEINISLLKLVYYFEKRFNAYFYVCIFDAVYFMYE